MRGILAALYFVVAPVEEVLPEQGPAGVVVARGERGVLRWAARGLALVAEGGLRLARLSGEARVVADYQEEGFLRIVMEPNVADNMVVWGPEAQQIFVNRRKLSCRKEGEERRVFYPVLNNREPCER